MVNILNLLVPLYVYPTPGAWDPVYSALQNNPKTRFQFIVNPDSGPGDYLSYPDDSYIPAVAKLHTYSNANLLCYVHTSYGERDLNEVYQDIDTCAHWSTYHSSDISISGIFFDEINSTAAVPTLKYLSKATTHARLSIAATSHQPTIVFNPGVIVDASIAALADNTVVFEDDYSLFTWDFLKTIPKSYASKAYLMILGFPRQTGLSGKIVTYAKQNLGGLYLTTAADYASFGDNLNMLAGQMAP